MRYVTFALIILTFLLATSVMTSGDKDLDIDKLPIFQTQTKTVRLGNLIYECTYKSERIRYFYCGILTNSWVIRAETQREHSIFPPTSKILYIPVGAKFILPDNTLIEIKSMRNMEINVFIRPSKSP